MHNTLQLFREKMVIHFPWIMLVLILIISVTINDKKLITNIYRVLACLPILFLIKVDDFKNLSCNKFNYLFMLLLGYTALTLGWNISDNTDNLAARLVTTFLFFYLIYLIVIYNPKKLFSIEKLYILSGFLFLIMVPFYNEIQNLLKVGGMTHSAFTHHSPLGWLLGTVTLICFYNYFFSDNKKNKYVYLSTTCLFLIATFINQSRGGILVATGGMVGIFFIGLNNKNMKKVLSLFIAALISISVLFVLFEPFFMKLIARADAGRFVIYQNAWQAINESWLYFIFGHGASANPANYIGTFKAVNYHNLYLDTWFHSGLIGVTLLVLCVSYRLFSVIRKKTKHNVWDAVLLGIIIGTMTDGGRFYTYPGPLLLCLITPLLLSNFYEQAMKNVQQKQSTLQAA